MGVAKLELLKNQLLDYADNTLNQQEVKASESMHRLSRRETSDKISREYRL